VDIGRYDRAVAYDWLLVETLGDEPVVVALGHELKRMVPLRTFLRRNPCSAVIATTVADTARTGRGVKQALRGTGRIVRTEVVRMSDGRVHGVHVWSGCAEQEPPQRPIPGPAKWDLTDRVATATRESLANAGRDPDTEAIDGRSFADDLLPRGLHPGETKLLSMAVNCNPGDALCSCWEASDPHGNPTKFGFVARAVLERVADGNQHLVVRAMNWRCEPCCSAVGPDGLAQGILDGLAQPGTHRALVSLDTWTLLKWLDEPCPHYDWRPTGAPMVHPADEPVVAAMTADFSKGPASGVLRLKGNGGGWVSMHVTVNRFQLDDKTVAGMISLRLPTETELAGAGLSAP